MQFFMNFTSGIFSSKTLVSINVTYLYFVLSVFIKLDWHLPLTSYARQHQRSQQYFFFNMQLVFSPLPAPSSSRSRIVEIRFHFYTCQYWRSSFLIELLMTDLFLSLYRLHILTNIEERYRRGSLNWKPGAYMGFRLPLDQFKQT